MTEHIEFAVRVPKDEADSFIARFGKGNVRIFGFLLGEEIVRCKDCARYEPTTIDEDGEGDPSWCLKWEHEWVAEDGFCYYGKRREK